MSPEHVDVLIVGAGLSGIAAAYMLQTHCPARTYAVLEARERLGGTWDLFRYPGIRSDSDMYTLGYTFYPWAKPKAIADGASILAYMHEAAAAFGIDRHIRTGQRMVGASWDSADARWTVEIDCGGERRQMTCSFLYQCTGYYDYDQGYLPEWPGMAGYRGRLIHPQHWDSALDTAGKSIVVIGSGATAVTLVPALAERAAHVTLLQRSPSYIAALPTQDALTGWMMRRLPRRLAYSLTRWKVILLNMLFYSLSRWRPAWVKRMLLDGVRQALGAEFDVEKHFTPQYNPWDQRLCLAPDGDLFQVIRSGKASVVTDHIETFTEAGLRLRSGQELAADVIVTATGLTLKLDKGGPLTVDGQTVDLAKTMNYKGAMLSDVPNFAFAVGYTNASWTLKIELTALYVCRLLNHMAARGYRQCTPRRRDPALRETPIIDFTSGYVQRALDTLPKQGSRPPWKLYQNYILDLLTMRYGRLTDDAMEFRA